MPTLRQCRLPVFPSTVAFADDLHRVVQASNTLCAGLPARDDAIPHAVILQLMQATAALLSCVDRARYRGKPWGMSREEYRQFCQYCAVLKTKLLEIESQLLHQARLRLQYWMSVYYRYSDALIVTQELYLMRIRTLYGLKPPDGGRTQAVQEGQLQSRLSNQDAIGFLQVLARHGEAKFQRDLRSWGALRKGHSLALGYLMQEDATYYLSPMRWRRYIPQKQSIWLRWFPTLCRGESVRYFWIRRYQKSLLLLQHTPVIDSKRNYLDPQLQRRTLHLLTSRRSSLERMISSLDLHAYSPLFHRRARRFITSVQEDLRAYQAHLVARYCDFLDALVEQLSKHSYGHTLALKQVSVLQEFVTFLSAQEASVRIEQSVQKAVYVMERIKQYNEVQQWIDRLATDPSQIGPDWVRIKVLFTQEHKPHLLDMVSASLRESIESQFRRRLLRDPMVLGKRELMQHADYLNAVFFLLQQWYPKQLPMEYQACFQRHLFYYLKSLAKGGVPNTTIEKVMSTMNKCTKFALFDVDSALSGLHQLYANQHITALQCQATSLAQSLAWRYHANCLKDDMLLLDKQLQAYLQQELAARSVSDYYKTLMSIWQAALRQEADKLESIQSELTPSQRILVGLETDSQQQKAPFGMIINISLCAHGILRKKSQLSWTDPINRQRILGGLRKDIQRALRQFPSGTVPESIGFSKTHRPLLQLQHPFTL